MTTATTWSLSSDVASSGNNLTNGLLLGEKWGSGVAGSSATVSYSFPDADAVWSTDVVTGYGPIEGYDPEPLDPHYAGLSAGQQAAVTAALQAWSQVANISFVLVAEDDTEEGPVGDIRVAITGMDASTYAYTYQANNTAYGGDVWINYQAPVASGDDFSLGANGWETVLHELGHAIGLDHPFGDRGSDPGFSQLDSIKYTVMSYSDAIGHQDQGDSSWYPTTPMLYDIQALQYLYGANMDWATTDDLYLFDEGADYYQTIWDAGGNDTIRYDSIEDGALIDLVAGHFSQLGNAIQLSAGTLQADDVAIAFNVTIENALGGGGADTLIGNSAANFLAGSDGNDSIRGGAGADTLEGDAGADTLWGGAGADNLAGGAGNDVADYRTSATGLTVDLGHATNNTGEAAGDTFTSIENVAGSAFGDVLAGDGGANLLDGGEGNDKLSGGGGGDSLVGGAGFDVAAYRNAATGVIADLSNAANNTGEAAGDSYSGIEGLVGSASEDWLTGDAGANQLAGGGGNDTLDGGSGNDELVGGAGADSLSGRPGVDLANYDASPGAVTIDLEAGTGSGGDAAGDTLSGVENVSGSRFGDVLTGSSQANTLNGGIGADTMQGLAGNDSYYVDDAGDKILEEADSGFDGIYSTITYLLPGDVEFLTLLEAGSVDATGNALDNILTGNEGANALQGLAGGDTLDGGVGNDFLQGNQGEDSLMGGTGGDLLWGGKDQDRIFGGDGDDDINGNLGNDTIDAGGGNDTVHGGQDQDYIVTGDGNDSVMGDLGDDFLQGNAGDDWLDGGVGDDQVFGGRDQDRIYGGDGDDDINGNIGNDTVESGAGNDIVHGGQDQDYLITGEGNDTLFGDLGNDFLQGNMGDDSLDGGSGNDQIFGGRDQDRIFGGEGDDDINGNIGNDTIEAGSGNDTVHGGQDNDVIVGGAGNDSLMGDLGDDLYRYDSQSLGSGDVTAGGHDTINATAGELISMLGLNDDLALSVDATLGSAIGPTDRIAFTGGILQIDVNGDHIFNAADDFQISLTGVDTISYHAADGLFLLS